MTRAPRAARSRRSTWLRRGLPILAAAALLAGGLFLVLPHDEADRRDEAGTPIAAPSTAPGGEPAAPTTGPPPAPITEAPAAAVVVREGMPETARTVAAVRADFTSPSDWADGVSVRVVRAEQSVSEGSGPGARAGQPRTAFVLELTNGAGAPLDIGGVVVQAVYGPEGSQASPLYDEETLDFGGALAPGEAATAVHAFAIPEDGLGAVTLTVDVDGFRFPAVFAGAVPVR